MSRRRWCVAVAALALAAPAAACGGPDGSDGGEGAAGGGAPAAGSDKDAPAADGLATAGDDDQVVPAAEPCEIVTAAEIEGVLGTRPVHEGRLNGATCGWPVGEGAGAGDFGSVGISLTDTARYTSTAEEGVASMREGFGGAAVEIAGLGDEAIGDGAGMIAFRSGDWYVTVGVYADQDPAANQAAAEALAHIVLDRL